MPAIDVHPSASPEALREQAAAALRQNRLDPKFLYATARQADLWRQVFLRHSPGNGNPEFARIYREAFALVAPRYASRDVLIAGLGCGTGAKEAELCRQLGAADARPIFTAVDVSHALVAESMEKLAAAGAQVSQGMVCDLAQTEALAAWLDHWPALIPRLLTFFGLVPNLEPALVLRLFHVVLRPGDQLLVSAHLAPVQSANVEEIPAAMQAVLPQYDNPETLAWLAAGIEEAGLAGQVGSPVMTTGGVSGIPAFVARSPWKKELAREPFHLFHSLRYTPWLFDSVLREAGFAVEQLALTACREEALWAVRLPSA